ncbi:MAG TPA: SurA N-terminal domain-containing protein [Candidatus Omnitrophota bacterium]|nr:SurA N-terminal domain-containing protein [Candidatus Omnitrophota bacterium]
MLKIFRQHTKVMVWIVAAALIFLFGVGSIVDLIGQKNNSRFAGEVFGQTVTFKEYKRFAHATQLFMPSENPLEDPDLLREYTWQNIIYSREAKRQGINVSDKEVQTEIASLLKQQGLLNPTPEQYKYWLMRVFRTTPRDIEIEQRELQEWPREFEEGLREIMRIQKLLRGKVASLTAAGSEKLTDEKAKEEISKKSKEAFMKWTQEVNKKAALKDYLAVLKQDSEESPSPATDLK